MTVLVVIDTTLCPDCGTPLGDHIVEERTLFRHGGYGAMRRTERAVCPGCGWTLITAVSELKP